MATKLGSIIVEVKAKTASFIKGMGKAKKSAKGFQGALKSLTGALAVLGGAAGLGLIIKKSVDAADAIGKNAVAVGLSAETYQEFAHAADLAGTNQSAFTSNMTAFVKRVGEARKGVGPLVSSLKRYDQELLSSLRSSKNQEDALNILANAIKNAGTAVDRAALANAAFGRSGINMTTFLKEGSAGIEKLRKRARELGNVLSNESVKGAEDLKDKLTDLSKQLTTRVTAAVIANADAIKEVVTAAISAVTWIGKFVNALSNIDKNSLGVDDKGQEAKFLQQQKQQQVLLDRIKDRIDRESLYEKVFGRSVEKQAELKAAFKAQFLIVRAIDEKRNNALDQQQKIIDNEKKINDEKGKGQKVNEGDNSGAKQNFVNIDLMQKQASDRIEVIRKSFLNEAQLSAEALDEKKFQLEEAFQFEIVTQKEKDTVIENLTKEHNNVLKNITEAGVKERKKVLAGQLGAAASIFGSLSSLATREGKKQSLLQKTLARASIIASTAQAVMNALAVSPYPLGVVLAVAAGLKGAQQLAKVGGGGGGLSTSVAGLTQTSTGVDLGAPQGVTNQVGPQGATQIIFTGDMLGEDLSERLIDIIKTATNDRDIVVFDGDSRQAQEIRDNI